MPRPVKIGLFQVDHDGTHTYEEKTAMLLTLARGCLDGGAELVFFPEAFQYTDDRAIISDTARLTEVSSEWKERCAALAAEYNAYIAPWDYEYSGGRVYNSSYILDRSGVEIGRYRKVHLTYTEQQWGIANGDDFPVFELDFGKVGIMICFDNYWPEAARILALRGAKLILYPLYGDTLVPQWELKIRVRAADNMVYIASSQIGTRLNVAYSGLVNPHGDILARLDRMNTFTIAEVDFDSRVLTSTGGSNETVEDLAKYLYRCRRPQAYSELTAQVENAAEWDEIFVKRKNKK